MTSVRLHHPAFASCTYVVELPQDYLEPGGYDCPTCGVAHQRKAIHLHLDAQGDVFVAEGIYELLLQVGLAGMEVSNAVDNAPTQRIGAVEVPTREIYTVDSRFYVPGRTKYESADIMQKPFQPLADKIAEGIDREATAKKMQKRSTFLLGRRK